jgi:hypothetical protein
VIIHEAASIVQLKEKRNLDGWVGGWIDGWMDDKMENERIIIILCILDGRTNRR